MAMKNEKLIFPVLFSFILLVALAGCENEDVQSLPEADDQLTATVDENRSDQTGQLDIDNDSSGNDVKQLVVDGNKCLGCGKCVRLSADYFRMDGGRAVVITPVDLTNPAVNEAVSHCPVGAIKII